MISFKIGPAKFTYRVAGVIIDDGHVLVQTSADDSFYFLPGGRAEMMETSEISVKREMCEELRLEERDVQVQRLLWVVENLFHDEVGPQHEIGFYYLVTFANHPELHDKTKAVEAIEDTGEHAENPQLFALRWLPLSALDEITIYPAFLKTGLRNLPVSTQHIIETDIDK
jgi:8-oxo-dGTP pyrophosphatase MutT (NUDIX family)